MGGAILLSRFLLLFIQGHHPVLCTIIFIVATVVATAPVAAASLPDIADSAVCNGDIGDDDEVERRRWGKHYASALFCLSFCCCCGC